MTWLLFTILIILIILGCIGFDKYITGNNASRFIYIAVGLTTLVFGLHMYFEYKINGEIHYSPRGLPVIIKDKIGAYMLSFGLMCVGAYTLCKGLFTFKKN